MTDTNRAEPMKPCPFCGGEAQFRKALWPSDGCTDAVIHAPVGDCGMGDFSTGTTDESVIAAWNRRAEVEASRLPQAGAAPSDAPDAQLCKFYDVSTFPELVAAMEHHIEKLQARLPATPSLAPQRVREG